jgi:hypothetical protein
MAIITPASIADLVTGTLQDYQKDLFEQLLASFQDYVVVKHWFKSKDRIIVKSGRKIDYNVAVTPADVAEFVGLFADDNTDAYDHLQTITVPWTFARTGWIYDYSEALMNRGRALITEIVKPREQNAIISMANLLENAAASVPTTDETHKPYGLPYWLPWNATDGFNGGAPDGHTTVGGMTPGTNTKNYTLTYTTVNYPDLFKKLSRGFLLTKWHSPVSDMNEWRGEKGNRYMVYGNADFVVEAEDQARQQTTYNSPAGKDLLPVRYIDDMPTIRKFKIQHWPVLDSNTADPIYCVDHNTFFPVVMEGNFMRTIGPDRKVGNQSDVFQVIKVVAFNFICINKRANIVAAKPAPL